MKFIKDVFVLLRDTTWPTRKERWTDFLSVMEYTAFFAVYKWDIAGSVEFKKTADYSLFSILEGAGELTVDGLVYPIKKGSHFILPSDVTEWTLSGDLQLIVSHP